MVGLQPAHQLQLVEGLLERLQVMVAVTAELVVQMALEQTQQMVVVAVVELVDILVLEVLAVTHVETTELLEQVALAAAGGLTTVGALAAAA
jgi:hypothetical protein